MSIIKAFIRAGEKETYPRPNAVGWWTSGGRERRIQPVARDGENHAVCRAHRSEPHVRRVPGRTENQGAFPCGARVQ